MRAPSRAPVPPAAADCAPARCRPLVAGQFLVYWLVQGVWVWVSALPLLLLNSDDANPGLRWTDVVGCALWATGFLLESVADWQKLAFKRDPANRGKFIDTGLWSLARYPNYGGACEGVGGGAQWLGGRCGGGRNMWRACGGL